MYLVDGNSIFVRIAFCAWKNQSSSDACDFTGGDSGVRARYRINLGCYLLSEVSPPQELIPATLQERVLRPVLDMQVLSPGRALSHFDIGGRGDSIL
jgi:hypothetical protein